ncbi:hypothetical protein IEQ34_012984 [Dendrobium chrysotoxum]|uniref:Uncharacterized protein n=1 Tax=Dendrobium chrysotoxum TaxID=161865 RepID=A0AAV7GQF3_DENCH|nr:hypothetical protein IEQ34_012984 [Dendrobium chrysotoxum]
MEEMLRRLLEMQTKPSRVVPMANPNQDLTGISLAESKGKEIKQEEFDEGSFFHQEPPPVALIRGGSGFLHEGTTKIKSFGGGGRAANHYERHFGQEKPLIGERGGQEPPLRASIRGGIGLSMGAQQEGHFVVKVVGWPTPMGGLLGKESGRPKEGVWAEPWGSGHVRRREGRWDSHPRYMGEIWRDHDNRYTGRGSIYCGGSNPRVRKLGMPVFERKDAYGWVYWVKMYLMVNGVTEKESLTATALCLEGKALARF